MAFLKTVFSCLAVVLVLVSAGEARYFVVGKEKSWKIPSDTHYSYNDSDSSQHFLKGDHLVFKYDGMTDSVVKVNYQGYKNCDARKPNALRSFNNEDTAIQLNGPGPCYFISGNTDNCEKGEKLEILLVKEHHHDHHESHISPAPAPTLSTMTTTKAPTPAPAPAPASGGNSFMDGVLEYAALVLGFGLGFWLGPSKL